MKTILQGTSGKEAVTKMLAVLKVLKQGKFKRSELEKMQKLFQDLADKTQEMLDKGKEKEEE
jgi:predicted glycosyltransferase